MRCGAMFTLGAYQHARPDMHNGRLRDEGMSKYATTIKHELHAMLVPTIYFFVVLHIVALIRVLVNKGTGIELAATASIAVAALVLGKAVVIADALPFINRFPEKPLIWNVCWKLVLYWLVALVIHYLERLYDFWKSTHSLTAANEKLLVEMVWPHFWAIQILLSVLILIYCVMNELARVVGRRELRAMFFGPWPGGARTVPPQR